MYSLNRHIWLHYLGFFLQVWRVAASNARPAMGSPLSEVWAAADVANGAHKVPCPALYAYPRALSTSVDAWILLDNVALGQCRLRSRCACG